MTRKPKPSAAVPTPPPAETPPSKGKPPVKLTLEQKYRRLKDANTQLRKDLAATEKEYGERLTAAEEQLDGWRIPYFNMLGRYPLTLSEYQKFATHLKEVLNTRRLLSEQLHGLCRFSADLIEDSMLDTSDEDHPLHWLRKLADVHVDYYDQYRVKCYFRGAFDLIDHVIRQCEYGFNFVYHLPKGNRPEVAE
jgi:hypothetical protein